MAKAGCASPEGVEVGSPQIDPSDGGSVVALFGWQAAHTPDAVAVRSDSGCLTYAVLEARANRLARQLRELGAGPDVPIGLHADRSLDAITGLLGILKAGSCYVPLDPLNPARRLERIARDAGTHLVVTTDGAYESLPDTLRDSSRLVTIGGAAPALDREPTPAPDVTVRGEHLVYILSTSGSTGTPKGVAMPHRVLLNLVRWQHGRTPLRRGERVLQFAPLGFDVAAQEILTTLCCGGELLLVSEAVRRNPYALLDMLRADAVARLFLPFVALQQLADAARGNRPPALRDVITAGEQLQITPAIAQFFANEGCTLHNHYGPTETHVVTAYTLPPAPDRWPRLPPIGRPLPNVAIYLLDDDLREVPPGATGELCVAGIALARGYHGRADLTDERFVANPFAEGRLFRTGDLAREGADGNLEFAGRRDDQVKIRGFRVEPAEVEVMLAQHPVVSRAVVLAAGEGPQHRHLVACVVPHAEALCRAGPACHAAHVEHWRQVWDAVYSQPAASMDATLNALGWTDSESGRPIPLEQMRQWADSTAQRILALRPRRVLEIGCGTGMLLFRVAPHCARYIATDVSLKALTSVEATRERLGHSPGHVTLMQRPADDFSGMGAGMTDTVVINSVVELFPGIEYLTDVIGKAVAATEAGGVVFVGDVRNLALMDAFHASTQLRRAPDAMLVAELRRRVAMQVEHDTRLFVHPAFFARLKEAFPRISHVQIQLRRGRHDNEMSRYRYDAWLFVERHGSSTPRPRVVRWPREGIRPGRLRRILREDRPECLLVRNVPNARLTGGAELLRLLAAADERTTAADLRATLSRRVARGVEPEVLWSLGGEAEDASHPRTAAPYDSYVTYAEEGDAHHMDVAFLRRDGSQRAAAAAFETVTPDCAGVAGGADPARFANNPLRTQLRREVEAQLRDYLRLHLPDYMVPARLLIVDAMPLTSSGKVDRRAVATAHASWPEVVRRPAVMPTVLEETIAGVWRDVLRVESIDVRQNFFEAGGTSLLLVEIFHALARQFDSRFTLLDLFDHPTIESLASHLARSSRPHGGNGGLSPGDSAVPGGTRAALLELRRRRQGDRAPAD